MKKKVLVVIAHPDDETIWCGGTLFKNKERWDMTILCFCRNSDSDRAPKFEKVCKIYKAKKIMLDFEDTTLEKIPTQKYLEEFKRFSEIKFNLILTHGKNGEYGHKRHKEIHAAVLQAIKKKILSTEKVFFFSYEKNFGFASNSRTSDKFIKLTNYYFNKKKKMICNVYGFREGGFEEKSCRDVETFKILKIK